MKIEDNIKQFFDKFSQANKLIFSKLLDTVKNEENNILGSLDNLKRKTKLYLGEEIILSKPGNGIVSYPKSNVNFRKEPTPTQTHKTKHELKQIKDFYYDNNPNAGKK